MLSRMRTCSVINSYTMRQQYKHNLFINKIGTTRIHNVCNTQALQLLFIKRCHDRPNIEMVVNLNGHGILIVLGVIRAIDHGH